jgi:2-phospho-L-lactate guanylyltransferase
MTYWAIVPIKPLRRSKSRLSGVLSGEERAELSRKMLVHTLNTLKEVAEIEHTLVVSRDTQALAVARHHGARTVAERGSPKLNQALVRATIVAQGYGVSGVLVLPADLPLISVDDIRLLVERAQDPPVVVIAPDRRGSGTNALLAAPPGLIEYDFGPDSFEQHVRSAEKAGARVEICEISSLGLDLDLPEDLAILQEGLEENLSLQESEG